MGVKVICGLTQGKGNCMSNCQSSSHDCMCVEWVVCALLWNASQLYLGI